MTLDEEIKHQEKIADRYTGMSEYVGNEATGEECARVATDHRQLAEWLTEYKELKKFNDKIYDVLAKQFGSPCNCNYAVDEYMQKNGGCDDCGIEISDKECRSRYIQTKLIGDERNEP